MFHYETPDKLSLNGSNDRIIGKRKTIIALVMILPTISENMNANTRLRSRLKFFGIVKEM